MTNLWQSDYLTLSDATCSIIGVLFADANGTAVTLVRNYIKPFTAYIFEIDLEYPDAIHDRDDDYPISSEVMQIKTEMYLHKQMRQQRLYYGDSNH